MKKIRKNDLRLEKEVISGLTVVELNRVKGGLMTNEFATCAEQSKVPCPIPPTKVVSVCNYSNCCVPMHTIQQGCDTTDLQLTHKC